MLEHQIINFLHFYRQILAALSVSIGSMVVGFSSAYTSPALVSMTDNSTTPFEVTEQEVSSCNHQSVFSGIFPLKKKH